jgi:hypothetical protein
VILDSADVEEEYGEVNENEMMSWTRMTVTLEVVSSFGFSFQL